MNHTTKAALRRYGLSLAALLLAGAAAPAHAAPREPFQENWLYVSVTRGDARSHDTHGALLQCDPPRGHVHAAEACAELAAAHGDIDAIPQKKVVCTMIYAPVTVRAQGRWNGQPVEYTQTFSSACMMGARTGAVFALDH